MQFIPTFEQITNFSTPTRN